MAAAALNRALPWEQLYARSEVLKRPKKKKKKKKEKKKASGRKEQGAR